MAQQADAEVMDRETFNEIVAAELEHRDRDDVAEMSREFDAGMSSMSAATVASEEGLSRDADAVMAVADLREQWHDEHYIGQGTADE